MFDGVFVINLACRQDRLRQFTEDMSQWPFGAPERFEAFATADGATGCTLSHAGVANEAIKRKSRCICVFEDDAFIIDGFAEKFNEFIERVPATWQCILLGASVARGVKHYSRRTATCKTSYGSYAYCLQGGAIATFRESLLHGGYADQCLSMAFATKWLPVPRVAGQRAGVSDIDKTVKEFLL